MWGSVTSSVFGPWLGPKSFIVLSAILLQSEVMHFPIYYSGKMAKVFAGMRSFSKNGKSGPLHRFLSHENLADCKSSRLIARVRTNAGTETVGGVCAHHCIYRIILK